MARDARKDYDVTMISPRNHFLFTPLLPSTTVGTLEFRCIIEPVRRIPNIQFFQANCNSIDMNKHTITCQAAHSDQRFDVAYDKLVIAVGAVPNTFGIPGVIEHCQFLKELPHARAVRNRILECFEYASEPFCTEEERRKLLHFVVVGGGPTSVETAAEIYDFTREDVHKWYPDLEKYVRITLLEATATILTGFDSKLADYAIQAYRRRNIDMRLKTAVTKVDAGQLTISTGEVIPFGLCVWSTGVAPAPVVRDLAGVKHAKNGRLLTDLYMRIQRAEGGGPVQDVYAIGDCATPEVANLAPTAQVAAQEAKYLAKALRKLAKGEQAMQFKYVHRGMLAYIGEDKALADLGKVKASGFLTFLFWRSAYLTGLLSWTNRLLVPMFWFKSWLFGRDISRF
eukprot:TRINITY_DN2711_c0_g2_i2.p1 TRINITY_DN2711_c0_g2~~TRINITY_DN2711_c0_g2_i2.p1  ORF type:complete len:398 (+),score=65.80 TRINITY_DN2711_c0_g2_i2:262-1455(+)